MTENWTRINGSPWHCYDGCFSTLGVDCRTYDGQPAWLQVRKSNGQFGLKAWHIDRLLPEYKSRGRK